MKIYEQKDGNKYSWLLQAPYSMRKDFTPHGWKWIRGAGCKGCYVTNDYALAKQTQQMFRIPPFESNGTHKSNTEMYENTLYKHINMVIEFHTNFIDSINTVI